MQVEELQKKREETSRALKAVSAKNQELEARMHHLSASASSSEQELRSEAAEVLVCSDHDITLTLRVQLSALQQCLETLQMDCMIDYGHAGNLAISMPHCLSYLCRTYQS